MKILALLVLATVCCLGLGVVAKTKGESFLGGFLGGLLLLGVGFVVAGCIFGCMWALSVLGGAS